MSEIDDVSFISFINSFDIICLLETFMQKDTLPQSILPDFERYFSPAIKLLSKHGRCSGGIYVFVKNTITANQIEITLDIDNIIAIELKNLSRKVIFISTYIPHRVRHITMNFIIRMVFKT